MVNIISHNKNMTVVLLYFLVVHTMIAKNKSLRKWPNELYYITSINLI